MINVLIKGTNRGIGFGVIKKYLEKDLHVLATARNIKGSKELLEIRERFPDNLEFLS